MLLRIKALQGDAIAARDGAAGSLDMQLPGGAGAVKLSPAYRFLQ